MCCLASRPQFSATNIDFDLHKDHYKTVYRTGSVPGAGVAKIKKKKMTFVLKLLSVRKMYTHSVVYQEMLIKCLLNIGYSLEILG